MRLTPITKVRTPDSTTPITKKGTRAYEVVDSGGRAHRRHTGAAIGVTHAVHHRERLGDSSDHDGHSGDGRQDRTYYLEPRGTGAVEPRRADGGVCRVTIWRHHGDR